MKTAALLPAGTWVKRSSGDVVRLTTNVEGGVILARDRDELPHVVGLTELVTPCAPPNIEPINKSRARNRKPK